MNPVIEGGLDRENSPRKVLHPLLRRFIVALLLFALLEGLAVLGLFHRLDVGCYDYFFRLRGVENPGQDVMIVALDDATVKELGPLPLPRGMHARLLSKLQMASAVTFNMTFDSSLDPQQEALFAEAIKKHGKVVLPCVCTFSEDKDHKLKETINLPISSLLRNAGNIGFLNIPTDDDTLVRRANLVDVNFSPDTPVPSIALATLLTALKDPLWKVWGHAINIAGDKIYMDHSNRTLFNYWGPAGTIPTVSYLDVIKGRIYPECFAGKIVVVGYTYSEAHDVFLTPIISPGSTAAVDGKMSGVEIQASVIQSLLNGRTYREIPLIFQAGFLFIIVIAGVLLLTGRTPLQRVIITPILVLVVLVTIYILWLYGLVFYPVVPLLGAVASGMVSQ